MPRPRKASWPGLTQTYVALLDAPALQVLPALAAVVGAVDADAGLAARRAAIRLARPEVERGVLSVGRIEREGADRVLIELVRPELLPRRIGRQSVVGRPDAASGGSDPDAADVVVLLRSATAVRRHHERGRPARRVVRRAGECEHAGLGAVHERAVLLPLAPLCPGSPEDRVLLRDRLERRRRLLRDRHRDVVGGIRALLGEIRVDPAARSLAGRGFGRFGSRELREVPLRLRAARREDLRNCHERSDREHTGKCAENPTSHPSSPL